MGFFKNLKSALNTDSIDFSKDIILSVPDYKLCLDWTIRKNCILSYIRKLLRFVLSGQVFTSRDVVKTARGVAGPWSNLDLPMLERAFEWNDISDEVVDAKDVFVEASSLVKQNRAQKRNKRKRERKSK